MKQIGRYRLDGVQGFGAFAMVWRGFDPELEIPVAVKILAENWAHHADVRERFLAEARLLRKIDSPRVIRVYDIGTHEERPFFVMDFIDGGTVADRVKTPVADRSRRSSWPSSRRAPCRCSTTRASSTATSSRPTCSSATTSEVLVADLGSAKRLAEASGVTVTTGTPPTWRPSRPAANRSTPAPTSTRSER